MPIALFIEILAVAIAGICFREELGDIIGGGVDYAIGGIRNIMPMIRRAMIVVAIIWAILTITLLAMGAYAHSEVWALILSVLLPLWFIATIMGFAEKFKVVGPVIKIFKSKCVASIIIVATVVVLFGLWSPEVKGSLDNWSYQQKNAFAGYLQKSSAKTEAENSNTIAKLSEDTAVYNQAGQAVYYLHKGTPLRIISFEKYKAGEEALRKVMIRDQNGDFVGGYEVFVPARKLTFL